MTAPRRPHRSFGRSQARQTQWVAIADQNFSNVASAGATLISSFTPVDALTVVRTRGQISIRPTTLAATIDIVGAYGEAVVSNEAFQAGVGSIPEPFSDSDWGGWLVWRAFAFTYSVVAGSTILSSQVLEIDSKAMRKMGPNDVLVSIAESQVGAYSISANTRTLIKHS